MHVWGISSFTIYTTAVVLSVWRTLLLLPMNQHHHRHHHTVMVERLWPRHWVREKEKKPTFQSHKTHLDVIQKTVKWVTCFREMLPKDADYSFLVAFTFVPFGSTYFLVFIGNEKNMPHDIACSTQWGTPPSLFFIFCKQKTRKRFLSLVCEHWVCKTDYRYSKRNI